MNPVRRLFSPRRPWTLVPKAVAYMSVYGPQAGSKQATATIGFVRPVILAANVSSGTAQRYRSSSGTDVENPETVSPVFEPGSSPTESLWTLGEAVCMNVSAFLRQCRRLAHLRKSANTVPSTCNRISCTAEVWITNVMASDSYYGESVRYLKCTSTCYWQYLGPYSCSMNLIRLSCWSQATSHAAHCLEPIWQHQ